MNRANVFFKQVKQYFCHSDGVTVLLNSSIFILGKHQSKIMKWTLLLRANVSKLPEAENKKLLSLYIKELRAELKVFIKGTGNLIYCPILSCCRGDVTEGWGAGWCFPTCKPGWARCRGNTYFHRCRLSVDIRRPRTNSQAHHRLSSALE